MQINKVNSMIAREKLERIRKNVEVIDKKILRLLKERFISTNKIQILKREISAPIHQKQREKLLLEKYAVFAAKIGLPPDLVEKVFRNIFSYSKKTDIMERMFRLWKPPRKIRNR